MKYNLFFIALFSRYAVQGMPSKKGKGKWCNCSSSSKSRRDSTVGYAPSYIPKSNETPRVGYAPSYTPTQSTSSKKEPYFRENRPKKGKIPQVSQETVPLLQYSSNYSVIGKSQAEYINDATALSLTVSGVTSHAPSDIGWISESQWNAAQWDGVPMDLCALTDEETCEWVFPNPNTMRGLKQLFDSKQPFQDNTSPTVAEIDAWNVEVIKHFRALFGITTPIQNDIGLYLQTQWADERKHTTIWDTNYPGTLDSSYGPCVGGTNAHCGASFLPNCTDQAPYLVQYPGQACVTDTSMAEGLISINTNIPWSVKLSRMIGVFLCTEGIEGHTGPFLSREKVGMSWRAQTGNPANTVARFKWGGSYTNPCPPIVG